MEVLFRSVRAIITFKAIQAAKSVSASLTELIDWHTKARYGPVDDATRESNQIAITHGYGNVLSIFRIQGSCFLIITDIAKASTTVMMEDEY